MRLKFVPKAGMLVPWPGRGPGDNHFAGRSIGPAPIVEAGPTAHLGASIAYVADSEPFEVESTSEEARRFAHDFCKRDGDVLPADEATAKFCGVPFVPVTQGPDDEWAPAQVKSAPALAPKGDV